MLVKCRYAHCKHESRELDKEDAVLNGKSSYYHKDCFEEMNNIKEVIDIYAKNVDDNPNYSLLQRTVKNLVYKNKLSSEFVLFATKYAVQRGWLKHELGLNYIVKDDKIKSEYEKYEQSKIRKEYEEKLKQTNNVDNGQSFTYKPTHKKSITDLVSKIDSVVNMGTKDK